MCEVNGNWRAKREKTTNEREQDAVVVDNLNKRKM